MRRPYNWCSNYDLCEMRGNDKLGDVLIDYELTYRHTEKQLIDLRYARSDADMLVGQEIGSTILDEKIKSLETELQALAITIDRMVQKCQVLMTVDVMVALL